MTTSAQMPSLQKLIHHKVETDYHYAGKSSACDNQLKVLRNVLHNALPQVCEVYAHGTCVPNMIGVPCVLKNRKDCRGTPGPNPGKLSHPRHSPMTGRSSGCAKWPSCPRCSPMTRKISRCPKSTKSSRCPKLTRSSACSLSMKSVAVPARQSQRSRPTKIVAEPSRTDHCSLSTKPVAESQLMNFCFDLHCKAVLCKLHFFHPFRILYAVLRDEALAKWGCDVIARIDPAPSPIFS